jgi:hypothetical protein
MGDGPGVGGDRAVDPLHDAVVSAAVVEAPAGDAEMVVADADAPPPAARSCPRWMRPDGRVFICRRHSL